MAGSMGRAPGIEGAPPVLPSHGRRSLDAGPVARNDVFYLAAAPLQL